MEQMKSQDRAIYELRVCPQCGGSSSVVRLTGRDNQVDVGGLFYVSQCDLCGLWFQNPSLRQEDLSRHYPDDYAPYTAGEMAVGRNTLWALRNHKGYTHLSEQPAISWPEQLWGKRACGAYLFPDYVPNGRLLEVACASGSRLELLRKLGWSECLGIEYSEYAARVAREKGFEVYGGRVEDRLGEIPDNSLDVIIASFVMEHLENPFMVANQLSAKLKPGGQFIFSTLNINSPDFWLWRENWYDLDLPRHYTFFRKRDLYQMLKRNFQIVNVYYQPAPNDYVGSARYWLRNSPTRSFFRPLNELIVALDNKIDLICKFLSVLGQATRISIHARKK